jgi:hypothetical protein
MYEVLFIYWMMLDSDMRYSAIPMIVVPAVMLKTAHACQSGHVAA